VGLYHGSARVEFGWRGRKARRNRKGEFVGVRLSMMQAKRRVRRNVEGVTRSVCASSGNRITASQHMSEIDA